MKSANIKIISGIILVIAGIILISAFTVGCSSSSSHPTLYNLSVKARCISQYNNWRKKGGITDFDNMESSAKAIVVIEKSKSFTKKQIQEDSTILERDVKVVSGNLPPSCVPNIDKNLSAALLGMQAVAKNSAKYNWPGVRKSWISVAKNMSAVASDISNYVRS